MKVSTQMQGGIISPQPPQVAVVTEIKAALRKNTGKIGKVFQIDEESPGLSDQALVDKGAGVAAAAVWQSRQSIRTMCTAEMPAKPSYARQAGSAVGGLMGKNPNFTPAAQNYLIELRAALDGISDSPAANAEEEAAVAGAAAEFEKSIEDESGIYVYTLPLYYRHAISTDPDRWMFKVGVTGKSIIKRVLVQQRLTGLPEDPIVLRAYIPNAAKANRVEKSFHKLLIAAGGHPQAEGKVVGKEWYATDLNFLDTIAEALDCKVLKAAT